MKRLYVPLLISSTLFASLTTYATVSVDEGDDSITLSNDKISVTIDKNTAMVTDIHEIGDINLVKTLTGISTDINANDTFYLDYHTGESGGVYDFAPISYQFVTQNSQEADLAFTGDPDAYLKLEYHFILRDGMSGLYSYVVAENNKDTTQDVAEIRTVYRFDARVMPHLYNGQLEKTPPLYADLETMTKIQDATWQLPSGEIYSKYDLANYTRDVNFWGVFGGGYGAWFIPVSDDYYPADPQMQELRVHQDAIALNYMTGAHLGSPDMEAPSGWKKLYGPWLVYLNRGDKTSMINDAARQAATEKKQWPYQWMTDERYTTQRATLTGHVQSDQPVTVVLTSDTGEDFDQETLGYAYTANVDTQGKFSLKNVNPGDYVLNVYALAGAQAGVLYSRTVTIGTQPQNVNITIPHWDRHVIWQIGQTNRRADEFKYAHQLRNYKWKGLVPADLTYTIGQSKENKDWYYAQTQIGTWKIVFNLNQPQDVQLDIAMAAASNDGMTDPTTPDLTINLNGTDLTTLIYSNDKAIYRSALQSGRYHLATIDIPASDLVSGQNTLEFNLNGGMFMYDAIVLSAANH